MTIFCYFSEREREREKERERNFASWLDLMAVAQDAQPRQLLSLGDLQVQLGEAKDGQFHFQLFPKNGRQACSHFFYFFPGQMFQTNSLRSSLIIDADESVHGHEGQSA
jgi:hypothetical protein